jgi:diaminopimelate decarboxylase
MNHFEYRNGQLFCEGVPLAKIAEECGTPTYVYSHATLKRHFEVFDAGLAGMDHLLCFAMKANSNLAVLALLGSMGAGADIVSGGELARALAAGIPANRVVFSGVGKTAAEMRQALEAGILCFNVESRAELDALNAVAGEMGKVAPISLRINPDVDPKTHPYISTGLKKSKFGVPWEDALPTYRAAHEMKNLKVMGVDCHIGSQLTDTSPFVDATAKLVALVQQLVGEGIAIEHVDVGGGLGIPYREEGETPPPSPEAYGRAIVDALAPLKEHGIRLICEPGRVICGNAGVMLTRVLYLKGNADKRFVVVDGALNDLMRPALYGAFHPIDPVQQSTGRSELVADVVGPICESGDFLAKDRTLTAVEPGELLAVGASGAYGFTMASNYNTRPRAAEILVKGDSYSVVRRRETVEELFAAENIPDWLR